MKGHLPAPPEKRFLIIARTYYKGDFCPLTECSLSTQALMAYQMDRPDLGSGRVLAFRRGDSPFVAANFALRGLDVSADCEVENVDTGETWTMSAGALAEEGVTITMDSAPESRLLFYTKKGE